MALANTGITSSIVGAKINTSSRKWSVLCSHSNINKWSKWKPVRYNTQQPLTLAQLKATNYGFTVPTPSANYASVVSAGWKYNKPTGTSTSPYRIGDFRNYYHNSVAPMVVQEDISMLDGQQALPISALITTETNPNSIGISDLTDGTVGAFGNYYYGVVVTSVGATAVMQTASTTIANGGKDFVLNSTHEVFSGTNIKAYHVFSNSRVDTLTPVASVNGVKFIPIPSAPNKSNISNITVNPAIDMDVIITGIGTKVDDAFYSSPSAYSIGGTSLKTMGALYLQLELINHNPNPQFFTSTALSIGANPTYFGANTNKFSTNLYTNRGVEMHSIEVPGAGGVVRRTYVRVGLEDLLNRDGGTAVRPLPFNIQGNTIITSFGVYKSGINIASVSGISAQARAVL